MAKCDRMSEADYVDRIVDTARTHCWHVAHFRPARTKNGSFRTPMQGDKGFPDLVLARGGRVILAEVKSDTGRLGPGQPEWLGAIGDYGRLWRPRDWQQVLDELRKG